MRLKEALEASLRENPDDLAAHMAYGDLLAEQDDPRGEFIQVQLALEDPSRSPGQRRELQEREAALLVGHLPDWLGPIHAMFTGDDGSPFGLEYFSADRCKYRFARGWLESLTLDFINDEIVDALGACPAAGLLREFGFANDDDDAPARGRVAALPFLGTMRKFRIGPDDDQCHVTGTGIAPAIARMPRLEELYLYAHRVEVAQVFALPMPHLRTLHADHLHEYPLEALADNPTLGNLVSLQCSPHGREPGHDDAYLTADGFTALVRSPHLRSLADLRLRGTGIGDRGIIALADSPMLARLRALDLEQGCVTDVGARALAAGPAVRGLRKLRLTHNGLTAAGVAALRAVGVDLDADGQYGPDSLAEGEYLWYGDAE